MELSKQNSTHENGDSESEPPSAIVSAKTEAQREPRIWVFEAQTASMAEDWVRAINMAVRRAPRFMSPHWDKSLSNRGTNSELVSPNDSPTAAEYRGSSNQRLSRHSNLGHAARNRNSLLTGPGIMSKSSSKNRSKQKETDLADFLDVSGLSRLKADPPPDSDYSDGDPIPEGTSKASGPSQNMSRPRVRDPERDTSNRPAYYSNAANARPDSKENSLLSTIDDLLEGLGDRSKNIGSEGKQQARMLNMLQHQVASAEERSNRQTGAIKRFIKTGGKIR